VKKTAVIFSLAILCAAALGAGGCCKSCSEKADLDVIPGMEDSGIPDVKAAKEHQEEIEQLNKDIEQLTVEMMKTSTDPSLSEAERKARMDKLGKELEVKSKRLEELAEDIANKDLK
jgi:TolA-binding protein